jgi:hypothetical protein
MLKCAIIACDAEAEVIYYGLSLCAACLEIAYELPDRYYLTAAFDRLIMDTNDLLSAAECAGQELFYCAAVSQAVEDYEARRASKGAR